MSDPLFVAAINRTHLLTEINIDYDVTGRQFPDEFANVSTSI